jgi:hypothetical protein
MDHLSTIQQTLASLLNIQDLDLNPQEATELNTILDNILVQLTPTYTQVPPLNLAALTQLHQPPQTNVSTPPPRLHVDRWSTPVSVEHIVRGQVRHVKWFSDAQLAYHYVKSCIQDQRGWDLGSFDRSCDLMKEAYDNDEDGVAIAWNRTTRTSYTAYYEPQEADAIQPTRMD